VLWYQGESNVKQASDYRPLMTTLMRDWRHAFGNQKLPFFLVQLAAHRPRFPSPGSRTEEEWPELREAQAEIAAADPHSALAVTIDLGGRDDIHPRNKRDVGRRLAQLALAKLYREPVSFSGPVYDGHKVEKDGRVRVRFRHAAGLGTTELAALPPAAPERRLLGFELSAADRKFVPAAAEIDGETVVLSAPGVKKPVAVRYAFSDDPVANLSNWAGLPAAPFRTDRWPRFSERLARLPLP
jgi:sialate O-acetylesterase